MKYFTFRQCNNNLLRYTHSAQVTPKSARTNTCLQSYFYRIVPLWNNLPDNIVLSQNFNVFKESLREFYKDCDGQCAICDNV